MNDRILTKIRQLTWKISPILFNEIDNHLFRLKKLLNKKIFKQQWLLEAIHEKLQKDEKYFKDERICFRIDLLTKTQLELRVKEISKYQGRYSKKQWILEAIKEQLTAEYEPTQQKLLEQRILLSELTPEK